MHLAADLLSYRQYPKQLHRMIGDQARRVISFAVTIQPGLQSRSGKPAGRIADKEAMSQAALQAHAALLGISEEAVTDQQAAGSFKVSVCSMLMSCTCQKQWSQLFAMQALAEDGRCVLKSICSFLDQPDIPPSVRQSRCPCSSKHVQLH